MAGNTVAVPGRKGEAVTVPAAVGQEAGSRPKPGADL